MANLNIALQISAVDNASGPIGRIKSALGGIGSAAGTVATIAGGALLTGIGVTVAGLDAAGVAGLGFNNSMEQVAAQLNAFTKDGEKTSQILDMIRERAAKTPFEFEQMAQATTALYPAATQSGVALEELIAQAEILAASNPAQGLEGAAFALKEAVGGDFTSIIERFNLPRQYLNQLKEEGVPAAQAVGMAMQQMGLDASLVSNLAETASGRWSTLKDTFVTLSATVTQPIFNAFSDSLGQVNQVLAENEPLLTALAQQLAGGIATGINWLVTVGLPGMWGTMQTVWAWISGTAIPTLQLWGQTISDFVTPKFEALSVILDQFITAVMPPLQLAWQAIVTVWTTEVGPALDELWAALGELFEALGLGTGETDLWGAALLTLTGFLYGVTQTVQALTPVIHLLGGAIRLGIDQVTNMVEGLASMKRGADAVIAPLQAVADKIGDLIASAANMPDWLIPGSPTPFELGLRGIGDAARSLPALALPGVSALGSSAPAGGLALAAPAGGGGGGITIGLITIQAGSYEEGQAAGRGFVEELRSRGLM